MTARLPVNAFSRGVVGAEVERLENSVIPLLAEDERSRPVVIGTALLLAHGGQILMITAEHVLSESADRPLFYFDADRISYALRGEWVCDDGADLAVMTLSPAQVASLSHRHFLSLSKLGPLEELGNRFYGTALGFPSSQAPPIDRVTIDPKMYAVSGVATFEPNDRVHLSFDKKLGMVMDGNHITPPDPQGMSGGPILGFPISGLNIPPTAKASIVAIATRRPQGLKIIDGPGVVTLKRLIDAAILRSRR